MSENTADRLDERAFDVARKAYHRTHVGDYGALRAAISAYENSPKTSVTDEMVRRFADVYYGVEVPHLMTDIRYALSFAITGELPTNRSIREQSNG